MQTNSQHSEHNKKSQQKNLETIDLGIVGQDVPIGMIECIQKLPNYVADGHILSMKAQLVRIKIDTFLSAVKSNSHVWALLEKQTEDQQNQLAKRILSQNKMQEIIRTKFHSLVGNATADWQYCPVEKLLEQKAEYDRFMEEQKLLNTVINKKDPVTGRPLVAEKSAEEQMKEDENNPH